MRGHRGQSHTSKGHYWVKKLATPPFFFACLLKLPKDVEKYVPKYFFGWTIIL